MIFIGYNIKLIREALELTQTEFADLLGVSRSMVFSYEMGKAKPKKIFIDKLSALINIPATVIEQEKIKYSEINVDKKVVRALKLSTQLEGIVLESDHLQSEVVRINEEIEKVNKGESDFKKLKLDVDKYHERLINNSKDFTKFSTELKDVLGIDDEEVYGYSFFEIIQRFRGDSKISENKVSGSEIDDLRYIIDLQKKYIATLENQLKGK